MRNKKRFRKCKSNPKTKPEEYAAMEFWPVLGSLTSAASSLHAPLQTTCALFGYEACVMGLHYVNSKAFTFWDSESSCRSSTIFSLQLQERDRLCCHRPGYEARALFIFALKAKHRGWHVRTAKMRGSRWEALTISCHSHLAIDFIWALQS